MASLKLSAPWIKYYREVEELFKYDPEVRVVYDEDGNMINLYVENSTKADALSQLLPTTKTFGNVELYITVIPANGWTHTQAIPTKDLFSVAFNGNPILSFIATVPIMNSITYVVFINKVVQYYNDDLGDVYGNCSTLYQTIADDVFDVKDGIYFCTDIPGAEPNQLKKYWP